jgi:hypothetical protein
MAPAVADLAGQTPLPVVAEATADGWRLTGVVPWASNLFADAVLVVPARTGRRIVGMLRLGAPGVRVRPAPRLLALDTTATGSVDLDGPAMAGGLCSTPSMMGTCCTAPVAVTLRRSGVSTAAALAYWLGNPLLNPAVLVFLVFVAPWQWTATRVVVGVLIVVGGSALVARLVEGRPAEDRTDLSRLTGEVEEDRGAEPVGRAWLAGAPKRFGTALLRLSVVLPGDRSADRRLPRLAVPGRRHARLGCAGGDAARGESARRRDGRPGAGLAHHRAHRGDGGRRWAPWRRPPRRAVTGAAPTA